MIRESLEIPAILIEVLILDGMRVMSLDTKLSNSSSKLPFVSLQSGLKICQPVSSKKNGIH